MILVNEQIKLIQMKVLIFLCIQIFSLVFCFIYIASNKHLINSNILTLVYFTAKKWFKLIQNELFCLYWQIM